MKKVVTKPDQTDVQPEFLSTGRVLAIFDIPKATLAKMRWNGTGPNYAKLGSRVLYRRSDIDAWIAANTREIAK
jgi:predicted DNA-binding transcriptional regulator AlpA